MSSLEALPAQQGQMGPGAQGPGGAQQPAQTAAPQMPMVGQGLPPTGLQQQLTSLNQFYDQVQNASVQMYGRERGIGFDPRMQQFQAMQATLPGVPTETVGTTGLDQMARDLAGRYGLAIGRGRLVDEAGNLMVTPEELVGASGGQETLGSAAAKLNYISQAIAKQQNLEAQQRGIGAIQTGLGQVQSRARGSLAGMMSGMYQDLADLYSNQEYEAADYSYYIQKEQLDIAMELQRRQEKLYKKQSRGQFIGGVAMAAIGAASGNMTLVGMGAGQAAGAAGGTGWF